MSDLQRESVQEDNWLARLTGDPAERERAIEELRELLLRGLSRSLSSRYGGLQADDIIQEALIKIIISLDKFEGRSRFTTWAMTIATRVEISELRRKHCQNVSLSLSKQFVTVHGKVVGDNSVGWVELTNPWWVGAFSFCAACEILEVKTLSDDPPLLRNA